MADPEFRAKVEKMKSDPKFASAVKDAQDVLKNTDLTNLPSSNDKNEIDFNDPKQSVQIGLEGLSDVAKDPKKLAEAMESLKDPEIAAEVKKMMEDPAFKAEMKKFTDSPAYKSAIKKTQNVIDDLNQDPVKLKNLHAQMSEIINN